MSGQFPFGNQLSGNNLSDFILGTPSRFLQGGGEFKRIKGTLYSLFGQDNIRITPKLKVEVGLRWDPYFPFTEEDGKVVCYAPGAKSQRFPNAPVGLIFGGANADPGCPSQTGSATNAGNFAPRIGFAYRLGSSGKAVIRGGAGIFYTPFRHHDSHGLVDTVPCGARFDYTCKLPFTNP